MLCALDENSSNCAPLQKRGKAVSSKILILSDHGNNHAGSSRRLEIRTFLKKAGYRITKSIVNPKDVVSPRPGSSPG